MNRSGTSASTHAMQRPEHSPACHEGGCCSCKPVDSLPRAMRGRTCMKGLWQPTAADWGPGCCPGWQAPWTELKIQLAHMPCGAIPCQQNPGHPLCCCSCHGKPLGQLNCLLGWDCSNPLQQARPLQPPHHGALNCAIVMHHPQQRPIRDVRHATLQRAVYDGLRPWQCI